MDSTYNLSLQKILMQLQPDCLLQLENEKNSTKKVHTPALSVEIHLNCCLQDFNNLFTLLILNLKCHSMIIKHILSTFFNIKELPLVTKVFDEKWASS